jgi:hypothetical protein
MILKSPETQLFAQTPRQAGLHRPRGGESARRRHGVGGEMVRNGPPVPPVLVRRRQAGPHRILGVAVHRDEQLGGEHQAPDKRARSREEEEPDRGVRGVLRGSWGAAHRPQHPKHHRIGAEPAREGSGVPAGARQLLRHSSRQAEAQQDPSRRRFGCFAETEDLDRLRRERVFVADLHQEHAGQAHAVFGGDPEKKPQCKCRVVCVCVS